MRVQKKNCLFLNRLIFTNLSGFVILCITKNRIDTMDITKIVRIKFESNQLSIFPRSRKICNEPIPVTIKNIPSQSIAVLFLGVSSINFLVKTRATRQIGILMKNIYFQFKTSVI